MCQIPIKPLSRHTKRITIKCSPSLEPAVVCLYGDKPHPQVFADFRRLAAKKALASSRNSFSSFRRRISLS